MKSSLFLTNFLACLSAIVFMRLWDAYRWKAATAAVSCFAILNVLSLTRHWYQGRRGLAQWPEPHGRFYDEWLRLPPDEEGDYYDWLAGRMGNREPWTTWARLDRGVQSNAKSRKS